MFELIALESCFEKTNDDVHTMIQNKDSTIKFR